MPNAAPKPCTLCGVLIHGGGSRCEAHALLFTGRFGDPARKSRQARGYGAAWERARKRVLERDNGLCVPCRKAGRISTGTAVDHVTPKAEGGNDDEANLQTICDPCHDAKRAREALRGRGLR